MLWSLFKGCLVATVALIIVLYFLQVELARAVSLLFGAISFVLILVKEEVLRVGLKEQVCAVAASWSESLCWWAPRRKRRGCARSSRNRWMAWWC